MTRSPLQSLLENTFQEFKEALVERKVYDRDHPNLNRAYNGAKDFVAFLVKGKPALKPRPSRK